MSRLGSTYPDYGTPNHIYRASSHREPVEYFALCFIIILPEIACTQLKIRISGCGDTGVKRPPMQVFIGLHIVWSPYTQSYNYKIEMVQRRAARWTVSQKYSHNLVGDHWMGRCSSLHLLQNNDWSSCSTITHMLPANHNRDTSWPIPPPCNTSEPYLIFFFFFFFFFFINFQSSLSCKVLE